MIQAEERIIILAPRGRDAEVMQQTLSRTGSHCHVCLDLADLRSRLDDEAGAILVTEEALAGEGLGPVLQWCEDQQPWSDLPIVVLTTKQAKNSVTSASKELRRLYQKSPLSDFLGAFGRRPSRICPTCCTPATTFVGRSRPASSHPASRRAAPVHSDVGAGTSLGSQTASTPAFRR
jgi:hypothetical protein